MAPEAFHPVPDSPLLPFEGTQSLDLGPDLNPGESHLESLNSTTFCKDPAPYKVMCTGAGGYD